MIHVGQHGSVRQYDALGATGGATGINQCEHRFRVIDIIRSGGAADFQRVLVENQLPGQADGRDRQ